MVKRKIIWSPRAKKDLHEILVFYFKRNGTKTYSKKLYLNLHKSVRLLGKYSDIGSQTDIPQVRNLIAGDYSIFYEIDKDLIKIIAIWDNRQNPENLSLSPDLSR
jgi:plasmid stabilization system protein ParE